MAVQQRANSFLQRAPIRPALLLSRLRVPLGFLGGAAALWLARPGWFSIAVGGAVAAVGEALRLWAAGHLEKGREVTKSGPYRWVGHPLYLGSVVIAAGIAIAGRSLPLAALAVLYVALTFGAAIRNEERELRDAYGRDYTDYRAGLAVDEGRRFSIGRAVRNREYRAVIGLGLGLLLFALKIQLML